MTDLVINVNVLKISQIMQRVKPSAAQPEKKTTIQSNSKCENECPALSSGKDPISFSPDPYPQYKNISKRNLLITHSY